MGLNLLDFLEYEKANKCLMTKSEFGEVVHSPNYAEALEALELAGGYENLLDD